MDGKPHSPARPFLTAGLFFWGLCLLFSLFLILAPGAAVLAADFEITPDELSFGPVRRGSSGNPGGPLELAVTSEECGYAVYRDGENVTVTAEPYPGYRFSHWSESGTNISTEAAYSFTAQEDRQLVAHYTDVHHPGGTGYAPLSAVINDINSQAGISFAVNTGDTACYSKAEEFAGYAADIMQLNVPVYESPGNHDLRWYCSNGKADFREKLGQRWRCGSLENTFAEPCR